MRKATQKWFDEYREKRRRELQQKPKQEDQPAQGKGFYDNHPQVIPSIIAAVMLLGALGQWPYGYYQLLRWVVCGVAIYIAVSAYNWKKVWAAWLFGFVAVLFNPLIPVHLSRDAWQPVDMVCSILFIFAAAVLREPSQNTSDPA